MFGSPSSIITMGYGTGSFVGSPSLVVTLGYGAGEAVASVDVIRLVSERFVQPTILSEYLTLATIGAEAVIP